MMDAVGDETGTVPNWHAGELTMQRLTGTQERLESRRFSRFLPFSHQLFLAERPFLVIGALDGDQWPWATIVTGKPGFLTCPDPRTLVVSAAFADGDPLAALPAQAAIGMLAIDFEMRLRIRINGRIRQSSQDGFAVTIEQSYGNCPKYIEEPALSAPFADPKPAATVEPVTQVTEEIRHAIGQASMLFLATSTGAAGDGSAPWGADASFRGGPAGFVSVTADGTLVIPDFRGNNYFNSLGNMLVHPRAGLAFPNFANGDLLLLSGEADVLVADAAAGPGPVTNRVWTVTPHAGLWLRNGLGVLPHHD